MYTIKPVARIYNERVSISDDYWGSVSSVVELEEHLNEECFNEIETFSHLEIIYYFDKVKDEKIEYGARHPRNNKEFPKVGVFAQRGKNRPNKLGATIVTLVKRENRKLFVLGLDAIDGTPVIDIKPVFEEFIPRAEIKQPNWSREIMKNYFKDGNK